MAPLSSVSQATETIYVRVRPQDKARLRALADRAHGGSMAAAVRWLLESYVANSAPGLEKARGRYDEPR